MTSNLLRSPRQLLRPIYDACRVRVQCSGHAHALSPPAALATSYLRAAVMLLYQHLTSDDATILILHACCVLTNHPELFTRCKFYASSRECKLEGSCHPSGHGIDHELDNTDAYKPDPRVLALQHNIDGCHIHHYVHQLSSQTLTHISCEQLWPR